MADNFLSKVAVRAVRLAAMAQLGPLAGAAFFGGGALAAKTFAQSDWAKAGADVFTELVGGTAAELLGCAVQGFRADGRNGDLELSLHAAAQAALDALRNDAPAGYGDWFDSWRDHIQRTKPENLFTQSVSPDLEHLESADDEFRAHWWGRMEPLLVRWRAAEASNFEQLHLSQQAARLPEDLAAFLRRELPEAMERAHDHVLRDENYGRSWIAQQQRFHNDVRRALAELLQREQRPAQPAAALWTVPPPTRHYQDRPYLIAAIDAALAAPQAVTALTALHGFGGIGKTQLARAYASQRRDRYAATAAVWLNAETDTSLLAGFAALAEPLGLDARQPDQQALARAAIARLGQRSPRLVILDNAPTAEAVRPWVELLQAAPTPGHLLLTSRSEAWDGVAAPVSVTQWSEAESVRFLLARTGQADHASATALARELDGLALALEHAAAYMRQGDGMPLAVYLREWRARLAAEPPRGADYPRSVAATLGLSLDRLREESPAAYELLCLFAYLAPDRIPRRELLEAGAAALPEPVREALAQHDRWTDVVEALARYSLVRRARGEDGLVSAYYVHRVVQQVIRGRMRNDAERWRWLVRACDVLAKAFPFDADEPPHWSASELLLPHTQAARAEAGERLAEVDSAGLLLNEASMYLRLRGLYQGAREYRETALASALRQFGPDHPNVATHRSNLAASLWDLGEHAAAREQIEWALEADLKQFGPDHPNVAISRSNLAAILRNLGEHAAAREQIEWALEADLKQFGPDHPDVAIRRSNLAYILSDLGEHAAAREQIEWALEADLKQFGPDHPNVAIRRSNLAAILRNLGEHAAAREQIEWALEADLKQFGPDHPNVAIRRSNLAAILGDLGEHAAAREQIEWALEADLKQFGPDHPNVAAHRSNLANILGALGEHAAARAQIELALEAALKQFGPDHPNVAIYRSNLAIILRNLEEHAAAREQIQLALDADLRQFGPDHPNVATRRSNLAAILKDLGEHAAAREQIELALDSELRQFGPDHPTVGITRWNLAAILTDGLGDHHEALKQIELALDIFRKKLPAQHPHIRTAEGWRAGILKRLGR